MLDGLGSRGHGGRLCYLDSGLRGGENPQDSKRGEGERGGGGEQQVDFQGSSSSSSIVKETLRIPPQIALRQNRMNRSPGVRADRRNPG